MKPYLFLAACVALVVSVGGCVSQPRQKGVSQKASSSQHVIDTPYYSAANRARAAAQENLPRETSAQIPPQVSAAPAAPAAPVAAQQLPPPVQQQPMISTPAQTLPVQPPQPAPAAEQLTVKMKAVILLPLSGSNASLGNAMLNAAQQAVFDIAGNNFELQPKDTAAQGGAEEATRAAVSEGAQIIIGPVFASDVPASKLVAQVYGLQMLPLSTDTSLADRGVYVMGLAPGAQVDRVVAFAAKRGAKRFAALLPASAYGDLVGKSFRNAVERAQGSLILVESFSSAARDDDEKISRLAAMRDQIDALFLPVGGAELKTVADKLLAAGFDPARVHILGTGLWDVPDLAKQSPLLAGAWYAAPDPSLRKNFIDTYKAAYGVEPPRLATLAYDATALAAVLAKTVGRFDEAALTNPNGFAGLDGIFRLSRYGEVERALAVNEAALDGAKVVEGSPSSFVGSAR